MTVTVSAPGKLYLAGEYSVLFPGQSAIVLPVPLYLTAQISPASETEILSDQLGFSVGRKPQADYALIQRAIGLAEDYLQAQGQLDQPGHFSLHIQGQLGRQGKKFGLGSSGCVVVVTIKAVLAFYGYAYSLDELFKLASLTLLSLGDTGSMGDLAGIANGQVTLYRSFDRQAVKALMAQLPLAELMARDWGYGIETLETPLAAEVLVGWTGQPALSSDMVALVQADISETFLAAMDQAVLSLAQALRTGQKDQAQSAVQTIGQLLADLHPAIYTPELRQLVDLADQVGLVAKSSGAGGGDCGIALSYDPAQAQRLVAAWEQAGIATLARIPLGGPHEP